MQIGYARISKGDDQSTALQRRALKDAGCERIFEEAASGGRWDRPELHRMIDQLRAGDVVTVWKLDRLSRSLKDLLHILDRIEAEGGGFRSLTENIDTTTPAGRMMMQMVGSFAEFERAMIVERTRAGMERARARGAQIGRAPTGDGTVAAIRSLRAQGRSMDGIARDLKIGKGVAQRVCQQFDRERAEVAQ